jgi:hypothetical protein
MTVETNIQRQIKKTAKFERIQKFRKLSPAEQQKFETCNAKYEELVKKNR